MDTANLTYQLARDPQRLGRLPYSQLCPGSSRPDLITHRHSERYVIVGFSDGRITESGSQQGEEPQRSSCSARRLSHTFAASSSLRQSGKPFGQSTSPPRIPTTLGDAQVPFHGPASPVHVHEPPPAPRGAFLPLSRPRRAPQAWSGPGHPRGATTPTGAAGRRCLSGPGAS
jgi:hypothetical protein